MIKNMALKSRLVALNLLKHQKPLLAQSVMRFTNKVDGFAGPSTEETQSKEQAREFMKKVGEIKIIDEIESIADWKTKVME